MIKAIIFDCFGVLTTEGWLSFKKEYFSDSPKNARRASEVNRLLDAGRMNYREGVQEIAEMAGVSTAEVDSMLRDVIPNRELLNYIRDNLKSDYRIGVLSNVAGNWLESFFTEADRRLFDVIALSYESGVLKPSSHAYTSVAERLGVSAQECIFIDDQERHCVGARTAGMRAILYKDFDQMRAELERLLATDAKG